jgi:hypothetical protein
MSGPSDKPRFALTLEAMPDQDGPAPALRLRRLLKFAGRVCRLRCTEVREIPPPVNASRPAEKTT